MYRAIPVNKSHIDFFSNLDEFYDVNYWRRPGLLHRAIDFVINPKDRTSFLRDADKRGVYLTTIIDDVQSAFDKQTVKSYIRRQMDSFDWSDYFRLNDIYNWLKDLEKKHPEAVKLERIGLSHQNRSIIAVKILLNKNKDQRPRVIIEGGIHAREWIGPAFVTYLINQILHADSYKDKLLKTVANFYEWYFVPVLNVDGYEYTHTDDRLWRKNRNGQGVDLNRNFGHAFGAVGVSWKMKDELYCGNRAFSEKESKAMADFIKSKSENLRYYVAFHSYGQYMILPYANSKKHVENYDEMYGICKRVAKKIAVKYNTRYDIGTAFDTVGYLSSGVSGCWVKNTFKVPYVVTFELRDNGYAGFALPPKKILPTCKETMDGVLELFNPYKDKDTDSNVAQECIYKTTWKEIMLIICIVLLY
ncbi:unnamed protein product [Arctia plantaginis]|uniref:Peptidase M14 domain-containing protein n=1 Tax=Arctia plantaginis TaxID=874455 RepID=A0A8S1A3C4_ARCPL|nr:unnamed protein product [Arctia plantaginis]